jgi:hypothetical protein
MPAALHFAGALQSLHGLNAAALPFAFPYIIIVPSLEVKNYFLRTPDGVTGQLFLAELVFLEAIVFFCAGVILAAAAAGRQAG